MKFLSGLLVACFVFISLSGMIKPAVAPAGKNCCHEMAGKLACQKNDNKGSNKSCDKQACPMMLSCSICGFLRSEPVQLQTRFANNLPKPVAVYIAGNLSAYHSSNWRPPKTC